MLVQKGAILLKFIFFRGCMWYKFEKGAEDATDFSLWEKKAETVAADLVLVKKVLNSRRSSARPLSFDLAKQAEWVSSEILK